MDAAELEALRLLLDGRAQMLPLLVGFIAVAGGVPFSITIPDMTAWTLESKLSTSSSTELSDSSMAIKGLSPLANVLSIRVSLP